MRLGGLASGMDTDSMVDQLMKAENMKVDRVEADKQVKEWQKENLNDLNKDFANFILDGKKDLGYKSAGSQDTDWMRSASSSDESIGTAVAGKGALEGKHTVKIESLAKGVSGVSNGKISNEEAEEKAGNDFDFKLNNTIISVKKGDTIEDIAKKINSSGAKVSASFDKDLGRFFISTKGEGSKAEINFTAVQIKDGDGIEIDDGNSVSGLNKFLGTIKVDIEETVTKIDPEDSEKTIVTIEKTQIGIGKKFEGTNGTIEYNGLKNIEIDSNQKTINGVTFDFKTGATKGSEFTVNVTTDADAIVDKVKKFVDDYNKIIEQASKLTSEKQNRSFRPLTDEQKEAMSEKEIEKWEEKAKSGLLRGDQDIEKTLSSLRLGLYEELDTNGSFKFITDIGISTQKYSSGAVGGLLEIDEDKLREKIAQDADGVMDVLFKNGDREAEITKADGTTKKGTSKGMINRIFDDLTAGMKSIIEKSGPGNEAALFRKVKSNIMTDFVTKGGRNSGKGSVSDIDNDMLNFDKKIAQLKERLARKEEMYFAQFAAMEKAMQKANSQGDWLMQQTQM